MYTEAVSVHHLLTSVHFRSLQGFCGGFGSNQNGIKTHSIRFPDALTLRKYTFDDKKTIILCSSRTRYRIYTDEKRRTTEGEGRGRRALCIVHYIYISCGV